MFWMRNKENIFPIHTLILRPVFKVNFGIKKITFYEKGIASIGPFPIIQGFSYPFETGNRGQ